MALAPTPTPPPSPVAPLDAPLQASPKLSFTFPPHGGLGFYAPTCSRCRTWSYEIYQRTLSGQPYCVACLNAGAGLDEIEALVRSINLKAGAGLDEIEALVRSINLNAGAGLDEIEALVRSINLNAGAGLDDLSPHVIDQASEVV